VLQDHAVRPARLARFARHVPRAVARLRIRAGSRMRATERTEDLATECTGDLATEYTEDTELRVRWLSRLIPAGDRESILGDLFEEADFRELAGTLRHVWLARE